MPTEFSNYIETRSSATPDGTELLVVSKSGESVRITAQQVADLASGIQSIQAGTNVTVDATDPLNPIVSASGGGGASDWGDLGGNLSDQTDLYTYLRATRTVTGADAAVQTDDNALIIFNSGSPFNFTLDQLTASSKISFMNIGAGAVTLVAGSGVTITGSVVIPGAVGTEYPSAFVFYHTATTPRVAIGGTESGRVAVAISTGTLTLDINNEIRRDFDLTATETGDFTIAFSNTTNWKESSLTLRLTGTRAITMPSTVRMENFENTVGRWNTSTRVLTLIGVTASPFEIRFSPQGSIIECFATDRFV